MSVLRQPRLLFLSGADAGSAGIQVWCRVRLALFPGWYTFMQLPGGVMAYSPESGGTDASGV